MFEQKKILIIGATSAIAEATARLLAEQKAMLILWARDEARLADLARDLTVRGASKVETQFFDALHLDVLPQTLKKTWENAGGLDVVLMAHGTLTDQKKAEEDWAYASQEFQINVGSVMALLTTLAPFFEQQGRGTLAVISSVAGDRGRRSNYVYGTAKAAVSSFLSGLRQRLSSHGVRVVTIKPGFVDTPMTAAFPKGFLWAKPETIAKGIVKSLAHGQDIVYLPGFWRVIMAIICAIPEGIFKKLAL